MKNGGKTHELVEETHNRTLTQLNQQQDFKNSTLRTLKLTNAEAMARKVLGSGKNGIPLL